MKNASVYITFLISLVLVSCGTKKQIISADGYGGNIDTTKIQRCTGMYKLSHAYDASGNMLSSEQSQVDSLVLSASGFYQLYKNQSLVEYGRYGIRKDPNNICLFFNYDGDTNEQYPELNQEKMDYTIEGLTDMVIDMYDSKHKHRAYWIRRFGQHLCFLHDLSDPNCFDFFAPKNATYWTFQK